MIVYTEQDKELVIPKGIGNLAGGSDYDSGYQDGYQVGYGEGRSYGYNKATTDIRNNAIVLDVTENGTYSANTADSIYFKEVNVNVGVDPSTWYASGYTDGYAAGYSTGVEEGFSQGYQSGSTDGFALGEATQRAKLVSTAVTENGTYSRRDGFSSFEVNVPGPYLGSGEVNMESILQTFGKNDLRPEGPNGEIVYGGDFDELQNLILEEGGVFQIKKWSNEEHTEYTLQFIMHPNEWADYNEAPVVFRPWSDIPSEWTAVAGQLYARNDGASVYFYWDYMYGAFFTDARDNILPDEVMFLDLAYDGISALTVNAQNIYDSGHTEGVISGYTKGYTDGFNLGYPSGSTDGYASGYTVGYNRRDSIKVINFFSLALGLNYGDSGVTMGNIDHITWGQAFAFYSDGTSWPVVESINTSIQYDSAGTKMILFEGDTLNDAGFGEVLEPSIDFHFHESVSNFQVKWLWLNYYVYNGQMMGGLKVNLYNSPQSGKDIVKTLF